MSYLKNSWYAIAWSSELAPGKVLARRLLDTPVAIFRSVTGNVGVLDDRCPHRFAPLHRGCVIDHGLQCGYHGLTFDAQGLCTRNPQSSALSRLQVRAYPVHEAHELIWYWPGNVAEADPSSVPNLEFIERTPPLARMPGYLHVNANFELITDNVLDLSHVDFLHSKTLAQGSLGCTRPKAGETANSVWVRWEAADVPVSPMNALYMGTDARVDLTIEVEWRQAACMRNRVTLTSRAEHGKQCVTRAAHLVTPETLTSSHYFFCGTREYALDDPKLTAGRAEFTRIAFEEEDMPMLEAVQTVMGNNGDLLEMKPLLLPNDRGSILARRKLRNAIALESAQQDGS